MKKRKRLTPDQLRAAKLELPVIHRNADAAPPQLVSAVKRGLRKLFITGLTSAQRKELRETLKGWKIRNSNEDAMQFCKLVEAMWTCTDYSVIKSYCPWAMPMFLPDIRRGQIIVDWKVLRSIKTKGGTFWYGSASNSVALGDKDYVPAFSRHAIERIQSRALGESEPYYDIVYSVHEQIACNYTGRYEPWIRNGKLVGFECWSPVYDCVPDSDDKSSHIIMDALGIEWQEGLYLLDTYHPCEFENRHALALTSLIPGMRRTPQYISGTDTPCNIQQLVKMRGFKQVINLQQSKAPIMRVLA